MSAEEPGVPEKRGGTEGITDAGEERPLPGGRHAARHSALRQLGDLLTNSTVQNWAGGIGSGALLAQVAMNLSPVLRAVFGALTLACLLINAPRLRRWLTNFFRHAGRWFVNSWRILLVFVSGVLIAVAGVLLVRALSQLDPPEVVAARTEVAEVESALGDQKVRRWLATEQPDGQPKLLYMLEYELISAQDAQAGAEVLRTYLKRGKRIAEDVQGTTGGGFARHYYREGCAIPFAADYFNRAGQHARVEYDKNCDGKADFRRIIAVEFPVYTPVITYR